MRSDIKLFLLGATAYPLLELAWRGRTHWSMSLAGGLGLVALGRVSRLRLPFVLRCLIGAASLLGLEFISGCLVNRWLGLRVWDYSSRRGHILGQICPAYAGLWLALAAPIVALLGRSAHRRRIS